MNLNKNIGKLLDNLKKLTNELSKPHSPDAKIIAVDLIIVVFLYFLTHPTDIPFIQDIGNPEKDFAESNYVQNIFAIQIGILALIFPIILFIAEKLPQQKDEGRTLIKESSLWHITFIGIGLLLVFFIRGSSLNKIGVTIVLLSYSAGMLISIASVIRILMNPLLLHSKITELYVNRMKSYNDKLLDLRKQNNQLAKTINENNDVHFIQIEDDHELIIKSDDYGIVRGINWKVLEKLISEVGDTKKKNLIQGLQEQKNLKIKKDEEKNDHAPIIRLRKLIGMSITEKNSTLMGITGIPQKRHKEIQGLSKKVYIIDKEQIPFENQILIELETVRDDLIQKIRENNIVGIRRRIDQLKVVTDSFLSSLEKQSLTYDYESAKKELNNFYDRFIHIETIGEIFEDAFIEAMKTENSKILSEIIYAPIYIAKNSLYRADHLIFQAFIRYTSRFYYLANEAKNGNDSKEFIFNYCHNTLSEITNYVITPQIEDEAEPEKIQGYEGYIKVIFELFINLMKLSYEKSEIEHFRKFCMTLNSIPNSWESLKYTTTPVTEIEKNRISLKNKIRSIKEEMFFGLAAFILNDLVGNTNREESKFLEIIIDHTPASFEDLTTVFTRVHNHKKGKQWGWDNWQIEENHGLMTKINTLTNLELLYAVRGLVLIQDIKDKDIQKIAMSANRDLYFLAERSSELIGILDDIKANGGKWKKLLTKKAISKVDNFKKLLNKSKKKQEEEDVKTIIKHTLTSDEEKSFISDVNQAFNKKAILRKLFEKNCIIIRKLTEYKTTPTAREYNQFVPKAAFIKDWHTHYINLGENFGAGIANTDTFLIINSMKHVLDDRKLNQINKIKNGNYIVLYHGGTINDLADTLQANGINFIFKWNVKKSIDTKFIKPIEDYIDGFIIVNDKYIPVLKINDGDDTEEIIFIDLDTIGEFIQYKPTKNVKDYDIHEKAYSLQVIDLSKDESARKAIIETKPKWLNKHENKEKFLMQKVIVKIFVTLKYIPSGKESGFIIKIPKTD